MNHKEVIAMIEEMDLPFAYHHFAEGEIPSPPFICFLYPDSDNFSADNIVYYKSNNLDIELYTDLKSPDLEDKVEEVLTGHELYFEKTETWIESERMYEVLYSTTV